MMSIKYAIILIAGLAAAGFTNNAQAQVSVRFNIGVQPTWGPVGYDYVRYYYIPDIDAYYDVSAQTYVYYDNNQWVTMRDLPPRYRNFDLYSAHKVVINEATPWKRNARYQKQYYRYRGHNDQQMIRNSNDRRYWENPGHPHHGEWNGNNGNGRGHGDRGHDRGRAPRNENNANGHDRGRQPEQRHDDRGNDRGRQPEQRRDDRGNDRGRQPEQRRDDRGRQLEKRQDDRGKDNGHDDRGRDKK